MPQYKPYDYSQRVMVPISLEEQLAPGTLEHAIHYLIEQRIDTRGFDERFRNDQTGRRAYDPKILLKLVLLAYARGMLSSRHIERACRENVVFMALSCGQAPDHSTIAAFVSSMHNEIGPLFAQVLLICDEEGLLGGTHFSLDGLKLSSNASKEWSGNFAELRHKQQKLEEKVTEAILEHRDADRRDEEPSSDSKSDQQRRQRRIDRLQRQAQRIETFLAENEPRQGVRQQEIRSNVTDNESGYLKTSHGMMQGYNAQALVDDRHQVITEALASSEVQDLNQLPRVLAAATETAATAGLGAEYYAGKVLTADSNYYSERNLQACEVAELDAYIPDSQFRKRDVRFATRDRHKLREKRRFELVDFQYDAVRDHYICPNGKRLTLIATHHRCGTGGWGRRYKASRQKCAGCPFTERCLQRNAVARNLIVAFKGVAQTETASRRMVAKIDTERGRKLYQRRLAIVEPVFANLRAHKRMDRFTLRGRVKVDIQWKLYCLVHNIGKLMNFSDAFN